MPLLHKTKIVPQKNRQKTICPLPVLSLNYDFNLNRNPISDILIPLIQ